jgi:transketolase
VAIKHVNPTTQMNKLTEDRDTRSGFGVGLLELGKVNPDVVALCADLTGSLKMDAFEKAFP